MNTLSLVLVLLIVFFVLYTMTSEKKWRGRVKALGVIALAIGVLGQLIGLFSAMQHIEKVGDISTSILAGGFKVSLITTMYGLLIFIISKLLLMLKSS